MTDDAPQGSPTLTFRGGGWVIALAAVLVLLVMLWSLLGPILGRHPVGDGRNLESYGYDLSTMLVPRESLRPSGYPRGFLPSLDDPDHLRGVEMVVYNEQNRPKYVVSSDRVLGLVVNGQAHAWPLSMLNAHEVVNDTVAGVPVVATYSPLTDCAMVFERTVAGSVRRFEVSGLLVDSNLVFVDKAVEDGSDASAEPAIRATAWRPTRVEDGSDASAAPAPHTPSLFLQLESRAVAGPLAKEGVTLAPLPGACITTWADWLAAHPETTVTLRDPQMIRRMKEISYARYFLSDGLEYPAEPMPDPTVLASEGLRLKSPMVLLELNGAWRAVSIEELAGRCDEHREVRFSVDGIALEATAPSGPAVARIRRADGGPLRTIPVLYFAAEAVFRPIFGAERVRVAD